MALTQNKRTAAEAAGAAPTPDSTVMGQFYGSSASLLYTVPDGRKWVGYFWPEGVNYPGYVLKAGGTLQNQQNSNYSTQTQWPPYSENYVNGTPELTLFAGDSLYSGANNNYRVRFIGVESDA